MTWTFNQIYKLFLGENKTSLLNQGKWGVEKEGVRTTLNGNLALTDHPAVFGDKFNNPHITTDFSESQIEIITPPFSNLNQAYDFLLSKQLEVEKGIDHEILWPLSMPPKLPSDENIPIAKFNDSEAAKKKEIYRRGLSLRYGRKMQLISGIHYNYSFSDTIISFLLDKFGQGNTIKDFTTELYFHVTKNFLRYRWILIYLFGASPTTDDTFASVIKSELKTIKECCPFCSNNFNDYKQYATSLRVSRFGYSSSIQRKFSVSFNDLSSYIKDIRLLLNTNCPEYEALGIFNNGIQTQLNSNILQNESEFYSSIRFKQIPENNETQLEALEKRGIKYIEVRILDLNPFERTGISLNQLHFIHLFLLYCLFEDCPPISPEEMAIINENHHATALFGRKPNLMLKDSKGNSVLFKDMAEEIFVKLRSMAELMDAHLQRSFYVPIVADEYKKISDPTLMPSSKILSEMNKYNEDFLQFGIKRALKNKTIN